jgi:hypothetical protein
MILQAVMFRWIGCWSSPSQIGYPLGDAALCGILAANDASFFPGPGVA